MPAQHHEPNPWLSEQVAKLRETCDEAALKIRFQEEQIKNDKLHWRSFLVEEALREAIKREPILGMKRVEMNLPEDIKQRLSYNQVEVLADLVQFPPEWLEHMPGLSEEGRILIMRYLEKLGYPLRMSSKPVYITCLPEYHDAHDRTVAEIERLCKEAKEAMDEKENDYSDNLKRAVELYEEAIAYAKSHDCDLYNYEKLVRKYSDLVREHYQFGDEYVAKAEEYVLIDIDLSKQVFGPRHLEVGEAERAAGEFFILLDRWKPAMEHYLESASITEAFYGKCEDVQEDLGYIGYCHEKMEEYQEALDYYLQAYEISIQRHGKDKQYQSGICFDISNMYRILGNAAKAKEFLEMTK